MADITRYNPIEDLFNELTRGFFVRPVGLPRQPELQIKLDVKEDEKAYQVSAEIPGVKKEDIHVDVEGSHVSLRAEVKEEKERREGETVVYRERSYGAVSRAFDLPQDVDADKVQARYENGVLNLKLPKKGGAAARRIFVS